MLAISIVMCQYRSSCSPGLRRMLAFQPRVAAPRRVAASTAPARSVVVRAMTEEATYIRQWGIPEFHEEVKAAFPEKMAASVEEARVLIDLGYTLLDVRSLLEADDMGKVAVAVQVGVIAYLRDESLLGEACVFMEGGEEGFPDLSACSCLQVPWVNCKWKYDPAANRKTIVKEDNKEFMQMIEKRFKDKETKFLVMCGNGKKYSFSALEALDEAGYHNLVLLKGGFTRWVQAWDSKMNRRVYTEYKEVAYSGEEQFDANSTSCGIHASGAGFINENAEAGGRGHTLYKDIY